MAKHGDYEEISTANSWCAFWKMEMLIDTFSDIEKEWA